MNTMAAENAHIAGLTLPPKVVGKVSGHLVMKVDEVLWARKPPGDVSAVVMWWGAEDPTTFRPSDVAQNALKRKHAGVIYEVCTSPALFDNYLRKCGSIEIAVADKYGMPIGCVSVPNVWKMMNNVPYQGYYPIVNNFGNRIGDLHVSFNLRMLSSADIGASQKLSSKQGLKTKELKRLSPNKSKQPPVASKSKEEKTKRNERVMQDAFVKLETSLVEQEACLNGNSKENLTDVESNKRVSPTSNIISQILEHGTRLRNAMTASVLEDGLQFVGKSLSGLNVKSSVSDVFSENVLQIGTAASSSPTVTSTSLRPCEAKVNPAVEKKVRDYLSGKPMSTVEEKEALDALRTITPTKDILENVVPDSYQLFQPNKQGDAEKVVSVESSESVTNITDYNAVCKEFKRSFDIDTQLLSRINCLRITIHSLLLNTVGIKRVGSYPKKKTSLSQTNIPVHPPGVTYFVEYKFPLASGSRPWESMVRYCSKRINGHEVAFGDRTVHNLPLTWRSSISEETNIGTLISSLSFKVCVRHLHQRETIPLGICAPDSSKELIESMHLRHEFDLPVVASNQLPVAQLRVCLELGRDRIHFGGLLDPDNNSLGMKSPRRSSSALTKGSSATLSKKKAAKNVTTVTRNIAANSCGPHKVPRHQASQAGRLIEQFVANVRSPRSLESSSAPSTGRSQLKSTNSNGLFNTIKAYTSEIKPKPTVNISSKNEFLKHEVALTILQVVGKNYLTYSTADEKGFYVSYKFPALNAMKNDSVGWHLYSTETSQFSEGMWEKPQNRIHSVIIPRNESFYAFLQHAFELHCPLKKCVVFSLGVRCYGVEVQDLTVAEATLPLRCLLTLEEAFKDAAASNVNFSSSSCSSIVLELPFELLPPYLSQEFSEEHGSLRLKVDYRHSVIEQPFEKANLPRSRGDSVTENIPQFNPEVVSRLEEKMKFKLDPEVEVNIGCPLDPSVRVPNWAKSPDKQFPPLLKGGDVGRWTVAPDFFQSSGFSRLKDPAAKNLHAAWETVQERSWLTGKMAQDSTYLPNCTQSSQNYKSIAAVVDKDRNTGKFPNHEEPQSTKISAQEDSDSLCSSNGSNVPAGSSEEINMKDAATSTSPLVSHHHTSTRGTSPSFHDKFVQNEIDTNNRSTSTEQIPSHHDKSLQVTIDNVCQASQTTPRDSKDEIFTKSERSLQESLRVAPVKTDVITNVLPRCSIDDVETIVNSGQENQSIESILILEENCVESPSEESHEQKTSDVPSDKISRVTIPSFKAKIGVECALHLQPAQFGFDQKDGNASSVLFVSLDPCELNGHISAHINLNPVSISPAVNYTDDPEWNWQEDVQLPSDLLISTVKRLVFKIWLSEKTPDSIQDLESANLIGFSALDLTVLSAGLPFISGWYNIMDFAGTCQGQIKLSVQPLEDISELGNFPLLTCLDEAHSNSSPPMFVAHCAYSEFPSHVTQFPDICVQKVDLQSANGTMSAILDDYQCALRRYQKPHSEPVINAGSCLQNDGHCRPSSSVPLQRRDENPTFEVIEDIRRLNVHHTETNFPESTEDVAKDPSILLREKLSELDAITKHIKSRLLSRVESSCATRSPVAPFSLPENGRPGFETCHASGDAGLSDKPPENTPHSGSCRKPCQMCGYHQKDEQQTTTCGFEETSSKWREASRSGEPSNGHSLAACQEVPRPRGSDQKSSQRQRKMWERQEDLIDFATLYIDHKGNEQATQNEDLSDWLSESALQQVFNPFLFNDILNSMNSSRGVQVVELDSESSDDNQDLPAAASGQSATSTIIDIEKDVSSKNSRRRSRRGDETYRKETPHFVSNAPPHANRIGLSAGDADSGVDVDVSANFRSGCFAAPVTHNESFLPHGIFSGTRTASTEREESSSCSFSSRHHQSTFPSSTSASATPTDSPQHSYPQGVPEVILNKRDKNFDCRRRDL